MAATSRFANGNHLLQTLSSADLALLEPNLERVDLPLRREMEKPNKRIEDVFFMEEGIASVVAQQNGGNASEIGIIGCEGMTGTAILLGTDRSPHQTYIQLKAKAHKISASNLRKALSSSPSLHAALLKFTQAFMVQTAHTAIANGRAKLDVRLARWILMAHDRVPGDALYLTHEFLALMLAVRRAGVTEAIHALQKQKLIDAHRSEITVLNRKGLEKIAGNFYGVPEAEYRRLFTS
jgi:CRP-like cAMP-binding protein